MIAATRLGSLFAVQMRRSSRMGRLYAYRCAYIGLVCIPLPFVLLALLGQMVDGGGGAELAKAGRFWITWSLWVEWVLLLILTPLHVATQRVAELKNGILDDILLAMGRFNLGHLERYAAQVTDFALLSLVTLPVAGMLMFMGSFPPGEYLLFKLTLVATLPLVVSITNLYSALLHKAGATIVTTYATIGLLAWLLPRNLGLGGTAARIFPSNLNVVTSGFDMLKNGWRFGEWARLTALILVTAVLLYILALWVEHLRGVAGDFAATFLRGGPGKRRARSPFHQWLARHSPVLWKEFLMNQRTALLALLLGCGAAVWGAVTLHAEGWADEDLRDTLGHIGVPYLVVAVSLFACATSLSREFQSRQMVMFFTAPMRGQDIFRGKLYGSTLIPAVIAVAGILFVNLLIPLEGWQNLLLFAVLIMAALLYGGLTLLCTLLVKNPFLSLLLTLFVTAVLVFHYFFLALMAVGMLGENGLAPFAFALNPLSLAGHIVRGQNVMGNNELFDPSVLAGAVAVCAGWTWLALRILARMFAGSMEGSVRSLR